MRHRDIGTAQAWWYPADRVLVLWECVLDDAVRRDDPNGDGVLATVWSGFERVLARALPRRAARGDALVGGPLRAAGLAAVPRRPGLRALHPRLLRQGPDRYHGIAARVRRMTAAAAPGHAVHSDSVQPVRLPEIPLRYGKGSSFARRLHRPNVSHTRASSMLSRPPRSDRSRTAPIVDEAPGPLLPDPPDQEPWIALSRTVPVGGSARLSSIRLHRDPQGRRGRRWGRGPSAAAGPRPAPLHRRSARR